MLGAQIDVAREELVMVARHLRHIGHRALVEAQPGVDLLANRLLVLVGDSQQHADDAHRHLRSEIGDEVEAARADQRIEGAGTELPHLPLERLHLARREDARQQTPVQVMLRRILEDEDAGREIEAALDQLQQSAFGGAVRIPGDQSALHVVEAAQREEVVAFVVVKRLLFAQPPPDRVRVGIDVEVVRIVVNAAGYARILFGSIRIHGRPSLGVRITSVENAGRRRDELSSRSASASR